MMIATYTGGKRLNVRIEPSAEARVVRKMERGERAECEEVRGGWAKLADGYADARFLLVTCGGGPADAEDGEPKRDEPPAEQDDAAELRRMTNRQLRELAEQSGVKVRKDAKKDEIIAAILADE